MRARGNHGGRPVGVAAHLVVRWQKQRLADPRDFGEGHGCVERQLLQCRLHFVGKSDGMYDVQDVLARGGRTPRVL